MNVGDVFEVAIDRFNHQGEGICIINGQVVFVKGALDGEKVKICIDHVSRKFVSAHVLDFLSRSVDRDDVKCPYYKSCGGCDIMHMNYNKQHNFKMNKVKDIIKKFVHEDFLINSLEFDSQFFYRNKATFHVKDGIGFFKEKSYDLISIDKCMISSHEINNVLSLLKSFDLKGVSSVVVRSSNFNKSVMVIFNIIGNFNRNIIDNLKDHVSSIYINDDLVYGEPYIIDKIGDFKFIISKDSFFQVNTPMAYKLYSKVKEYACVDEFSSVLDLYCGTGTIGLFVGSKNLVGIEINESAIRDARENALLNGVDAFFICGDSGEVLKKIDKHFDVVIVDPPRSGLSSLAINEVIGINASRIVYVSCDPITLARDLNILKEFYDIKELSLFDLFPNTHHVESVALLSLKTLEK